MRVVTFNIRHGLVTGSSWYVDAKRLGRTCDSFGADLLALQEVDRWSPRTLFLDEVALVQNATGLTAKFAETQRNVVRGSYGDALFARGTLSDVEVLKLPSPSGGELRVVILATAAVGEDRVSVAASHLSIRHKEALAQLDTVLAALERRPPPHVLLGDFNLEPGAVEPVLTAAGYAIAPTGPTFPGNKRRIDYVAVSGLTVVEAETPDTGLSDHWPVVAVVRPGG